MSRPRKTFFQTVTRLFTISLILIVCSLTVLDFASFFYTSVSLQEQTEHTVFSLVENSIKEPLFQGGFTEASNRLKKVSGKGIFECAQFSAWTFNTDYCEPIRNKFLSSAIVAPLLLTDGQKIGDLKINFDRSVLLVALIKRLLMTFLLLFTGAFLLRIVYQKMSRKLTRELESLLAVIEGGNVGEIDIIEFAWLKDKFEKLLSETIHNSRNLALAELAARVSHDIRSPIGTIELLINTMSGSEENKRILNSASTRVKQIANELLKEYRHHESVASTDQLIITEPSSITDIVELIKEIFDEKNQLLDTKATISFCYESQVPIGSPQLVRIPPVEFRRMLSNLIDNSFDATKRGEVKITLFTKDNECGFTLEDEGVGIPESILTILGTKKITHGKPNGTGFGLWHAHHLIKSVGGRTRITSKQPTGTSIEVSFPIVAPPEWLCESVKLKSTNKVIIVDDDPTIHLVWEKRLKEIGFTKASITNIKNADEMIKFLQTNPITTNMKILIDYDLGHNYHNGLSIIQKFGLEECSVLVTNQDLNEDLTSACTILDISILLKARIPTVEIALIREV